MKSLQDYIDTFKGIAKNLGLQGDSVEILTQLLANATYISEVENISYTKESSIEKASLLNSKIQHCLDNMYSVYRGQCPRVLIHFKSTKYFKLNLFDEICVSNSYKIYYLGYLKSNVTGTDYSSNSVGSSAVSGTGEDFIYAPTVIPPMGDTVEYTIIGLLAKESVSRSWTLAAENTYYVDLPEDNLSNDLWVTVNSDYWDVCREFSSHILDHNIFDLTLPGFGSRFYVRGIFGDSDTPANTKIEAKVFKMCYLENFNLSELKQTKIKGAVLCSFSQDYLTENSYTETAPGLVFIKEVDHDSVDTIHYKANRNRYMNSIIRSNSDIGALLEEMYPDKIVSEGTKYIFTAPESSVIEEEKVEFNLLPEKSNIDTTRTYASDTDLSTGLTIYANSDNPVTLVQSSNKILSTPTTVYTNKLSLAGSGAWKNENPEYRVLGIPTSRLPGCLNIYCASDSSYIGSAESAYSLILDTSVIYPGQKTIAFSVLVISQSGTTLLEKPEDIYKYGLHVEYKTDSSSGTKIVNKDKNYITIPDDIEKEITIKLLLGSIEFDTETLPVIAGNSEVVFNVSDSKIIGFVDSEGKVTGLPVKTNCSLYSDGIEIKSDVKYEIVSSYGIDCTISEDGEVEISGILESYTQGQIIVRAVYQETGYLASIGIYLLPHILGNSDIVPRNLVISDSTGSEILNTYSITSEGNKISYEYQGGSDYLYIWSTSGGIDIYSLEYFGTKKVVKNLISDSQEATTSMSLYYIPRNSNDTLTQTEIENFIKTRGSYYVTSNISIRKGVKYKAIFTISADVYTNASIDDKVAEILEEYNNTFSVRLEDEKDQVKTLLSKISNVKQISEINISYINPSGVYCEWNDIKDNMEFAYFEISYQLNTTLS